MDALEVETSIAEGEQALQALIMCARKTAGTLEAHEAEKGLFKRRLPLGLAAMHAPSPSAGRVMWDRLSRRPTASSAAGAEAAGTR